MKHALEAVLEGEEAHIAAEGKGIDNRRNGKMKKIVHGAVGQAICSRANSSCI
jgi:hypothetical protein